MKRGNYAVARRNSSSSHSRIDWSILTKLFMKRRHQCCCEAANLDLSSAALTSIKLWGSLACHTYFLHFQSHLWEQVFTCCRAFGICTVATHLTSVDTTWITQMFACDENTLTRVFILNHNHRINKWTSVNYYESHREKNGYQKSKLIWMANLPISE